VRSLVRLLIGNSQSVGVWVYGIDVTREQLRVKVAAAVWCAPPVFDKASGRILDPVSDP
jgi:hypothetical protein